jgi:hypothetical protein
MANANQATEAYLSRFSRRAFFASSRASSLVSVYRRAQHPRLRQAPLVYSPVRASSLGQRLICQTLSGHVFHKTVKACERMVFHVTLIEPEGEFIDIAAKMLRARMVIYSDQAAFENGENAFDTVCGDVAAYELPCFMIDRFMLKSQGAEAIICASFIRVLLPLAE